MAESSHVLMGSIESLDSLYARPVFLGLPVMLLRELELLLLLQFRQGEMPSLNTRLLDQMTSLSVLQGTCANLMATTTGSVL